MNKQSEAIKDALRACTTRAEVEAVSGTHRQTVVDLHSNKDTRIYAVHIINLKAYLLAGMDE
jgi:hypothetical protein